jgi:uncharacterized protein YjgD (DUF1641 family)
MAQPIRFEPIARDAREELRDRLDKAPVEYAEALLSAYEVLQGLHERGVLDILKGVLSAGDTVLDMVVDVAKTPEAIRSVRNLLLLGQVLGKIEPELLGLIVRSIPEGLAQVSAKRSEAPGLFSLLQKLCSKDGRRAMGAAAELLESFGKGLKPIALTETGLRTADISPEINNKPEPPHKNRH